MSAVDMFLGPDHIAIRTESAGVEGKRGDSDMSIKDRVSRPLMSRPHPECSAGAIVYNRIRVAFKPHTHREAR
jgi:hypothetical protein